MVTTSLVQWNAFRYSWTHKHAAAWRCLTGLPLSESRSTFCDYNASKLTMSMSNVGVCQMWIYIARLRRAPKGVFIATQLNSTSSCRHVHSVNNCHLSMNVVTQLTQFVGHDVINKNPTDLAVRCSTESVELCRYRHPSIATQLNSTSSWVVSL